ncbi:MAG: MBL fold metallo-hydrolase [Sulfitobacter sp.]
MTLTRRRFLATSATAAGGITVLPFAARAATDAADRFETPAGGIIVHPVAHATVVLETPQGTIYVDPVGAPAQYRGFPEADLVLITHEHGDHFDIGTLDAIVEERTQLIMNPAVRAKMEGRFADHSTQLANGEITTFRQISIEAIPAYNTTQDRLNFHPQGRDNGYVLSFEGFRLYLSGDTEDIPEMRGLQDIDLAFVCMNLPFTMDANAAASAVSEFAPTYCYPYHYRGRDGGTQDPERFARMVGGEVEVKFGDWYG